MKKSDVPAQRVTAIVSQNGNAYEEGLGDAWAPIRRYWTQPTKESCDAICVVLNAEGMRREDFVPAGEEAFMRDLPNAIVCSLDTGYFALETHVHDVAEVMRQFLEPQ